MEGAIKERLKREYQIRCDGTVEIAEVIYNKKGREALYKLWSEYIKIAKNYKMPFIVTTPTRRANKARVKNLNMIRILF